MITSLVSSKIIRIARFILAFHCHMNRNKTENPGLVGGVHFTCVLSLEALH
jgi:hypothetical protein